MHDRVKAWLGKRLAGWALSNVVFGVLWLAAGVVALAVAFALAYMAGASIAFERGVPHDDVLCLIGFGFVLLLFIGNATTSDEYLSEYSFSRGTASNELVTIYIPGIGSGSNINPLAPDSAHSFVKLIAGSLFLGPRLVTLGFRLFGKALRLVTLDVGGCAAVIALLYRRGHKVPYEQIAAELPWLRFRRVFAHLRAIDGILFLREPPPGLGLGSDLDDKLSALALDRG